MELYTDQDVEFIQGCLLGNELTAEKVVAAAEYFKEKYVSEVHPVNSFLRKDAGPMRRYCDELNEVLGVDVFAPNGLIAHVEEGVVDKSGISINLSAIIEHREQEQYEPPVQTPWSIRQWFNNSVLLMSDQSPTLIAGAIVRAHNNEQYAGMRQSYEKVFDELEKLDLNGYSLVHKDSQVRRQTRATKHYLTRNQAEIFLSVADSIPEYLWIQFMDVTFEHGTDDIKSKIIH